MAADKQEVGSDELPQPMALAKLKNVSLSPSVLPAHPQKKDFCPQLWVYSIWDGGKQQVFEFSKDDSGTLPISEGNFEIGRDAGASDVAVVKNS